MEHIWDKLRALTGEQEIASAAATLGEKDIDVKKAVSVIQHSLAAKLVKKGATEQVAHVVKLAETHNVRSRMGEIFKGHGIDHDINVGERMENAILGVHSQDFNATVAAESGVSREHADRLTNWVSAAFAAFLAKYGADGKLKEAIEGLSAPVKTHREQIPASCIALLGLSGVVGGATAHHAAANHNEAHHAAHHTTHHAAAKPAEVNRVPAPSKEPEHKRHSWIWWLMLLLLLLLLFFCWRTCTRKKVAVKQVPLIEKVAATTKPVAAAVGAVTNLDGTLGITLPGGGKLTVPKGGTEDELFTYLNSDAYRNAKVGEIKSKWFHFSHLNFVFNSPDEMLGDSEKHVENLATIMGAYPDAKFAIGAYADKVGSRLENFEISKKRAEFLRGVFEKHGVVDGRMSTEGFGKEYATVPAHESDAQRAIDRGLALQLKK